jgi:HK97 family phage major capsid protein
MTPEELAAARARREEIAARLADIDKAANARAENERELNEAEQTEWLSLETEDGELRGGIERQERADRVAESRSKWQSQQVLPDRKADPTLDIDYRSSLAMKPDDLKSRAQKVLDDGRENVRHLDELPGVDPQHWDGDASAKIRSNVQKLLRKSDTSNWRGEHFARLVLLSENPHYRRAFQKLLAGAPYFTAEEGRALEQMAEYRAALNITTDGQGGYAIPVLIDSSVIWTGQGHPNDFLQISRVENITNDEWKGITSAGATAYWTTEGVAATDGAPTIGQPAVPAKKLTVYIPYSVEVGGDWPGFAAEMATAIDMVWNEELVDKFTNGLGTTAQPTGFVTKLEATVGSQVASDDSGSATAADVYRMWAALPIKYRRSARWMAATAIENAIRQAGTTDPNFTTNLLAEGLPGLFNRPFHENDYMDGVVASTSDSSPLALGDWRNFLIANRVGMSVENIMHVINTTTGTPTGQRALYGWGRIGSDVINTNGFRILSQT